MTRAWRAWVELWDRREDAAALAMVRIGVGLVLLYDYVELWRLGLVDVLFTADGIATSYDALVDPHVLALAATVAAAGITLGALTRVSCVVLVLASAQLAHLAPNADRGIDIILRIVVGVLALSQSHARWSVDALVRGKLLRRPYATEVPAWPRYLLLAQLVWIYFSGGVNKGGAAWGPHGGFLALANVMADPHVARFDPAWLEHALPLTRVATALTMLFELAAPVYLLAYARNWQRVRWAWIALGLAFHLGIAITMRLGIFPWGMLALYPVLLRPAELDGWRSRLQRLTAGRSRAAGPETRAGRRP